MQKTILKASGLTCEHCGERVKNALLKVEGVSSVTVSLEKDTIEIQYDVSQATVQQLTDTVEDQGYQVM